MLALRSLLWIGSSDSLARSAIADCPRADLTWVADAEGLLDLPPASFDAAVLAGECFEDLTRCLKGLAVAGEKAPPAIACLLPALAEREDSLRSAGAAEVLVVDAADRGWGEALLERVDALAKRGRPWQDGSRVNPVAHPSVIGSSAGLRQVLSLVSRAARSTATVLLTGETGTGKEVIANAIHESGPRRSQSFVAVNCAAFPDTLLESELFGHVRGAFTGADRDKRGLFEVAAGGTIFLDEIGETSASLQAKLLRVLQEREVRPVGGSRSRRVDVRVVAATNRLLAREVEKGSFREDLYYRLAVFPIPLPPLRKRNEDILPLAEHFLGLHGRRERKLGCTLSAAAASLLLSHNWPGNVRELENEMQRALALAEPGERITPKLLSDRVAGILEPIDAAARQGESLHDTLARIEGWLIRRSLEKHAGRRTETARVLGITREGLYKKMKRLGVE